ncbi:DUF3179 domain-containing protein [Limibacillus sp. MBR-115]|jgi:hypothetical protein|uniref:DUF3179 domain-containing protein n=1 Tax=Limibacillus sp. MBR-115 TaxID=3156465 RepID=UPI00339AF1E3
MKRVARAFFAFVFLSTAGISAAAAQNDPSSWSYEWPDTDFTKTSIDLGEVISGGPPKDGIPAIDDPKFKPQAEIEGIAETEPVIGLIVNGEAKAYPLRVLTWHEIVNDTIGEIPVAVTYCPLCNAAIVFDRRIDGKVLDFGTTGKLRHSDLVMYDRQTESWWQQFLGEAIVGDLTGKQLAVLPARLESYGSFKKRRPDGLVLVPENPDLRPYGANPYSGYDSASVPFLYRGGYPKGIAPMAYVVVVGEEAWSLDSLKKAGTINADNLVLEWKPGMNSALDSRRIADGQDIGQITAMRDGVEVAYDLTFAFVFHAFKPDGRLNR